MRLGLSAETIAGRWGLPSAVGAFFAVLLVVGMRTAVPMLSYDDIYRALFAHEWSEKPFFFTYLLQWLPFPLMATGIVARLTGEVFWTSLAVDVAATILCLCYLHRMASRLFGTVAGWSATALFGLVPWVVFLALSRYSEPILLAAAAIGVYHWLGWNETGRARDLASASIALGAAVLTRYEAWPLGLGLACHGAVRAVTAWRSSPPGGRPPAGPALWCGLPLMLMAIWALKNLADYGTPLYGSAQWNAAPAGVWGGFSLIAQFLWQLSPLLCALGVVGFCLYARRAPLLACLVGLSAIVPWYTVSLFRVAVAYQVRLMLLTLMLIAPFAGAVVARAVRAHGLLAVLAGCAIALEFAVDLGLQYPSRPLPMTALALQLVERGVPDQFDALYVESPGRWGYPDEVRVATNFRRPVEVLPSDTSSAPWRATSADAILVLSGSPHRPGGDGAEAFVVSRVEQMTAWGLCQTSATEILHAEWLNARVSTPIRVGSLAGARLTLRNSGSRIWPANACGVSLVSRWLGGPRPVAVGETRSPLRHPVKPGETIVAEIAISAPPAEGDYTLEFDLRRDRPALSGAKPRTLRIPVRVTGG